MVIPPIRTWDDLFALPGFVASVVADRMKTGAVVQDYEMEASAGERPCGIAECHTNHRKGYVISMPGDSISNVGWRCGKVHFGAEWSSKVKAFRAAKDARAKEEALASARAEAQRKAGAPHSVSDLRISIAIAMLRAFDALPEKIRDSVLAKAADGDPAIYGYRAPTQGDKAMFERQNKKAPSQIRYERAKIDGLSAFAPGQRVDTILKRIDDVRLAIIAIAGKSDATPDAIRAQIRRLDSAFDELESSTARLARFFEQPNISNLALLAATERSGYKSVKTTGSPSWDILLT